METEPPNPTREPLESDPSLQKKHQSMLDRLTHRHQSRLDTSLTRRSDPSPSFESTSAFLSRFSAAKSSVDSQLSLSRRLPAADLKPHLDQISAAVSDLEKLVAENSYFLPSYEVRSSLKSVSDLRQTLDNLSAELLPKKKFSFRNKAAAAKTEPKPNDNAPAPALSPEKSKYKAPASPGIWNRKDETIVRKFSGSEIGEFSISDLESCEVRLLGTVRALFVHRLRQCRVYTGPVTGSVLIDGAEDCVFVMASHQIRIHNAKRCDFYLRVRSRPIIEDSCGVRFAPYCLRYDGIEEELRETSLDEETGNWSNVDDFLWLRAVQSPNWCVLPENERVGLVDVSSLEES